MGLRRLCCYALLVVCIGMVISGCYWLWEAPTKQRFGISAYNQRVMQWIDGNREEFNQLNISVEVVDTIVGDTIEMRPGMQVDDSMPTTLRSLQLSRRQGWSEVTDPFSKMWEVGHTDRLRCSTLAFHVNGSTLRNFSHNFEQHHVLNFIFTVTAPANASEPPSTSQFSIGPFDAIELQLLGSNQKVSALHHVACCMHVD